MADKSMKVVYGVYVVEADEKGSISVTKNGNACDNAKGALREIAQQTGFEVNPDWTSRQFGSKLMKHLSENAPAAAPAPQKEEPNPAQAPETEKEEQRGVTSRDGEECSGDVRFEDMSIEELYANSITNPKALIALCNKTADIFFSDKFIRYAKDQADVTELEEKLYILGGKKLPRNLNAKQLLADLIFKEHESRAEGVRILLDKGLFQYLRCSNTIELLKDEGAFDLVERLTPKKASLSDEDILQMLRNADADFRCHIWGKDRIPTDAKAGLESLIEIFKYADEAMREAEHNERELEKENLQLSIQIDDLKEELARYKSSSKSSSSSSSSGHSSAPGREKVRVRISFTQKVGFACLNEKKVVEMTESEYKNLLRASMTAKIAYVHNELNKPRLVYKIESVSVSLAD